MSLQQPGGDRFFRPEKDNLGLVYRYRELIDLKAISCPLVVSLINNGYTNGN